MIFEPRLRLYILSGKLSVARLATEIANMEYFFINISFNYFIFFN